MIRLGPIDQRGVGVNRGIRSFAWGACWVIASCWLFLLTDGRLPRETVNGHEFVASPALLAIVLTGTMSAFSDTVLRKRSGPQLLLFLCCSLGLIATGLQHTGGYRPRRMSVEQHFTIFVGELTSLLAAPACISWLWFRKRHWLTRVLGSGFLTIAFLILADPKASNQAVHAISRIFDPRNLAFGCYLALTVIPPDALLRDS